jgi:hypothetical protein
MANVERRSVVTMDDDRRIRQPMERLIELAGYTPVNSGDLSDHRFKKNIPRVSRLKEFSHS